MTVDMTVVPDLVSAAANGDPGAWRELVDRYSPLLLSVIRSFRLSTSETEDVAQTVWLRAVEHLGSLREPRALPMWLITTGRREALRFLASSRRVQPFDPLDPGFPATSSNGDEVDERLLLTEMHKALLAGLAELPSKQRDLLRLLLTDPPPTYAQITAWTGIPTGSIGPTRARALERLRQTLPVREYLAERRLNVTRGGGSR
jgi:RNA polymerase sigma factor (sigma-70 family)